MSRNWLSLLPLAALALGACAGVPATGTAAPTAVSAAAAATPEPLSPVVMHDVARNIQFTDTAGATHKLDEFKGKYVVLVFFAHWCGICQHELPVMEDFGTKYKDKNTVVVPVEATGAGVDIVKAFAERYKIGMPLYYDVSMAAPNTYLVDHYPFTYMISPDFKAEEGVLGPATFGYLEQRYNLYAQASK
jgi:thiol-disulfide isomerase/thioredoxin